MENKINKTLNLILLLSILNGNILSMQKSDIKSADTARQNGNISMEINQDVQQESRLLGLPAEVIEYILYQIVKPYENSIRNVNNIFDYCQIDLKTLKEDLSGVSLTSKDLRLWTLDLINRLRKLKENKYQELVNQIKNQYRDLSKDELNGRLRNILNQFLIDKSNLKESAKLILADANVDEKDNYGHTALMFAAIHDCKAIVQLLINKHSNVNETNNYGVTALMLAARNGCKNIAQLLIGNGANVNQGDDDGDTALILAAENGHNNIVNLLIALGANIDGLDSLGYTALMNAIEENHKGTALLLIKLGADISIQSKYGDTALDIAKRSGYVDIIKLLQPHNTFDKA